ncbi:MAG: extracellular solute-binding protein [Clostridiales bacterium]|jgi:multiple sugar transport system substrate-binding protein|nr:extracellular solute-binding protein [Clostridiales bacterium]
MNRWVKALAAVLCAAMTAGVSAGCANKAGDGGAGGVKTVTVWSSASHSKTVYEAWIKRYNETEGSDKGIRIDYQVKDSTYSQTLKIALQNGTAPDLFEGGIAENADNGYVVSLEDIAGGKEFIAPYGDLPYSVKHKGKVYGVPITMQTQGLVYNKDMFRAAGIVDANGEPTPPKTFDELREYAKRLTDPKGKKYGIILPLKWPGWFGSDIGNMLQTSVGHMGFDPTTGKYDYTALAPVMKAYLGMKEDGSVFPGAEGVDNDPARAQFSMGNVGMKIAFHFDVGVYNDQFPATCDFGIAPLPVADLDNAYKQRADVFGSLLINKASVAKLGDAALLEAVRFFTCDETLRHFYEQGVDLPYKWDIVAGIDLPNAKKGWREFAQMTSLGALYPREPDLASSMGANAALDKRFIEEVWNGGSTPEALLADYTRVRNEALEKYLADHPEDALSNYLDKDYISKNKR